MNSAVTSVSETAMVGVSARRMFVVGVAVCQKCRDKARAGDFGAWHRIRALIIASDDRDPNFKMS